MVPSCFVQDLEEERDDLRLFPVSAPPLPRLCSASALMKVVDRCCAGCCAARRRALLLDVVACKCNQAL
jgi:hypothetical protein